MIVTGGSALDRLTRAWVRATGRALDLPPGHWLDGPSGDRPQIGDAWLQREADRHGGRIGPEGGGLLPSVAALDGPGFTAAALHPAVREFYEDTAAWRMDVWSQWSSVAWPGGWLVSALFARRLGQLSLPLRPLDVAHGMSSEVVPVVGAGGEVVGTSWRRTLRGTGNTVYAGWYGVAALPDGPAVRVSFPLPDGRLVVLLRPENAPGGALRLVSGAGGWGGHGTSLVVQPGRTRPRLGPSHPRARALPRARRRRGRPARRPRPAAVVGAGAASALPPDPLVTGPPGQCLRWLGEGASIVRRARRTEPEPSRPGRPRSRAVVPISDYS